MQFTPVFLKKTGTLTRSPTPQQQQNRSNSTCDCVLNQIKPYLGYFAIDAMRTIFSSNYNGLQVKTTKRFAGGDLLDANFTWSRNLTNSPADYSGFIQNIYNPDADYGRASDDRKLILTLDGVFALPWFRAQHGLEGHLLGGWEISAIYAANSGLPLAVSASAGLPINYNLPGEVAGLNGATTGGTVNDNAGLSVLGNTNAGLRPNQIADPNNGYGIALKSSRKLNQSSTPWFYTGAFTAQNPLSNTRHRQTRHRQRPRLPARRPRHLPQLPPLRPPHLPVPRRSLQRRQPHQRPNRRHLRHLHHFGQITGYRDARILQLAGRFDF